MPLDLPETAIDDARRAHPKVTDAQADLVAQLLYDGRSIRAAADHLNRDRSWAYITLRKPHVQAYATDLTRTVMGVLVLRATSTLSELLDSARSDWLRKEIATEILDRAERAAGSSAPRPRGQGIKANLEIE